MAAGGGYNAPNLTDTSTSFGSDAQEVDRSSSGGGGGGISSQPLFGIDYKRYIVREHREHSLAWGGLEAWSLLSV